ncbi:MAG: DUF1570 domain-containing protein [Pirellulales bacterium]
MAPALDHVAFHRDGRQQAVTGKVIVRAQDGGLLLMARDGSLWSIEPAELDSERQDDEPFEALSPDELSAQLLSELPAGFEVHRTRHYLICHNTSRAYAAWCGALYERLHSAFTNYWTRKGVKLDEPEFPLVAIVFSSRDAYAQFAAAELGTGAESIVGYYSLRSNRITMYDLTGLESLRNAGGRRGSAAQINQVLSRPEAEQVVATIVHEATHQIAFNTGLQTRFADIPLWVSEGLAVYFETPDLQSAKGWRGIGAVNGSRLTQFREYQHKRPAQSIKSLISDDTRLRDVRTALDAYAEAWALNYYLLQTRPREYLAYLQVLAAKKPLLWDDRETRLREFQAAFGDDLDQLDADFLRHIDKLR